MTEPLYLGVDAGNSKTVAVIADATGTVLGWGRAGCGDIYADTEEAAVGEVVACVGAALDTAAARCAPDRTGPPVTALCLAGIDWPEDVDFWRDAAASRLPGLGPVSLRNDGFALLRAGAPDGLGVAVSVGTGAAAVGRGPDGAEWSASMWITHPAGGGDLGRQALNAVVRAELGLGPATLLSRLLPQTHGADDVADLLFRASRRRPRPPVRHAAAARTVLAAAAAGDAVAQRIVADQGEVLAGYAAVAAARVGFAMTGAVPVVLGGSVAAADRGLSRAFTEALARRMPAAQVRLADRPPVLGAVLQAMAEGRQPLAGEVLARLDATGPPREVLAT